MAVISVLVKRAAKDKLMNHLLCTLFFYAACYKFLLSVEHEPGVLNVAAEALSRDNVAPFLILFHRCLRWTSQCQYWTCGCWSHQTGALLIRQHCSGSFCPGISTQHLQHVQVRNHTLFGLLSTAFFFSLFSVWFCFVSFLFNLGCAHPSILLYLSALSFLPMYSRGSNLGLADFLQLQYVVLKASCISQKLCHPQGFLLHRVS